MEIDLRTNLLQHARKYQRQSGLSLATIATKVMNDGKFFDRIENGGGFTVRTYEKCMQWFSERIEAPNGAGDGS